ncbi:oligopeptidase A [Psychromonas sp. Urea-02u-13]|uniref:oligopeptidase A n=1 Tax=Psychromonas sp. Urea-02u-13 TaxID=2058326 RepID=UPI000C32E4D5|nr:oligopeptidase A [Psychromonas sp. Urea-02u-13]PKG40685.1 oligopeptidase A [Psychromonas sp. Urea-02u-13]
MNKFENSALNKTNDLPLFSEIKVDQIVPIVTETIESNRALVETLLTELPTFGWDNFVNVLDEADDHLGKLWSPVSHMNSVVSNDALREAHDTCLPIFAEYSTFIGQHQGLYEAYLSIKESAEFNTLKAEQQKVIINALRDFKLAGIALSDDKKRRYGEIKQQLASLQSQFSNHVMDATLAWSKLISDVNELAGLPESAIAAAKQAANEKEQQGYLLTLDFPSYFPVITYAKNRELRKEVYTAFSTRASDQGPNAGEFDNSEIIEQLLALRHEVSQLLDFNNYAEYSLATKMAETPDQVINFLTDLAEQSQQQAVDERDQVLTFAQEMDGLDSLQSWDLSYYSELLKQQRYTISDETLRPYFPENKVVEGLFAVVKRLFGLVIKEQFDFNTWHKDVRFFHIYDNNNSHLGSFYLDLYAREFKRGGAWMNDCRVRRRQVDGSLQLPVAYLTCNFNKPVGDEAALFTHNEVVTLFHEFGHGIHHMLTKIESSPVSGINGVPWDAVELPSQFLENWCWEPEALALISGHVETGETLPAELLEKMLDAKNYNSALMMVRQLEFSLFDFVVHHQYNAGKTGQVETVLNEIRNKVAVITPPSFNRFQHSFSHIFAGGYAAGYYSYKWAEVLSADAFSRFEEEGIFNAETGKAFLQAILEKGGSDTPMTLFKSFMGREPNTNALLRHCGIK